jgi:hypothetical protein
VESVTSTRRRGDWEIARSITKVFEDAECPEMGLGSFGVSELPGAAGEGSFDAVRGDAEVFPFYCAACGGGIIVVWFGF